MLPGLYFVPNPTLPGVGLLVPTILQTLRSTHDHLAIHVAFNHTSVKMLAKFTDE